jgi:hypothetical protein
VRSKTKRARDYWVEGGKKNNDLFRTGTIMPGEINFTLTKSELPYKEDHL